MPVALAAALGLALVLAVSRGLRGALARAGQPPVMAEVLAGLVLGAAGLGAVPGDPSAAIFTPEAREVLRWVGAAGVAAYLFRVGARLPVRELRRERGPAAAVALVSFAVPWVAGVALAVLLHGAQAEGAPRLAFALFVGTALAVTAFPVLARLVDARGLADRPAGRIALAAAAGQELLVWPALAVAVALGGGAGPSVARVLALGAGAIALVVLLARVVAPSMAARALGAVSLLGLAASAAATEAAGLHLVLGAFLYGALLPAAPREAALALLRRRGPALALAAALPAFFAVPALRADPWTLGVNGLALLALVLLVAAGTKLGSASLAARAAGVPGPDALLVGVLMNARGLVELVVLSVGLDAGLVGEDLFTALVVTALVTTFAAGPLVALVDRSAAHGAREPAGAGGHASQQPAHLGQPGA